MKHPWAAFYWGDYFADTVHLTQGQHGAYLLLLGRYHANGEPLQANDEQLQRICRANTKQERNNVATVLSEFFVLADGHYHNNRADEELAKRSEISTKRSLAAQKKGANKSLAIAEQKHTQPQPHIQPQNLKSKATSPAQLALLEIYSAYPRKIGKPHALKAIEKAIYRLMSGKDKGSPKDIFSSMDDAVVFLIQRVRMFARSPAGQNGQFTPHPATWFNQSRYTDDETEWSKDGNGEGRGNSKAQQRLIDSGKAILEDLGLGAGEAVDRDGEDLQDGDSAGRTALMGEFVARGKSTNA